MEQNPYLTFAKAKQLILNETLLNKPSVEVERIALADALNRIIAAPIISPMNVPSFNNSAMDGYAVRLSDLAENKSLMVADTIFAGDEKAINWPKNSCLRIMTGAQVPLEADAIIMQEETQLDHHQHVIFPNNIKKGQNIRYIGESVRKDAELFPIGEKLTIPKLTTLATLGISHVEVYKPITVAVFSTGNELTPIGESLSSSSHIYDSNRFTICLLLQSLGCHVIDFGIIKDDLTLISQTLQQAAKQADLVITSGGVSVGDADYTKQALENIGQINFWKIAMKPGKPFAFGKIGKAMFCGLPGNPVSTLVTFYQLVRPLIQAMLGNQSGLLCNDLNKAQGFLVKTDCSLKKSVGRVDFQRGHLYVNENGELVVTSTGQQGSHLTTSFHNANCFIVLEKDRGNVNIGEDVTVELFESCLL